MTEATQPLTAPRFIVRAALNEAERMGAGDPHAERRLRAILELLGLELRELPEQASADWVPATPAMHATFAAPPETVRDTVAQTVSALSPAEQLRADLLAVFRLGEYCLHQIDAGARVFEHERLFQRCSALLTGRPNPLAKLN